MKAFRAMYYGGTHAVGLIAKSLGIGATDVRALVFVSLEGPVTPTWLADMLELSTGATTTLIDRLESHGYLHREPNPDDRRSVRIALDAAGAKAMSTISEFYREALLGAVAPEDYTSTASLMERIGKNFIATAEQRHGAVTV